MAEWVGCGMLVLQCLLLAPLWYGLIRPRYLSAESTEADDAEPPAVSIIVPARDEETAIEGALRRFLALDYPHLEVIAIDDRSADGTGAIMDRVAGDDPRCRVIHVRTLPPGWLGKNHANRVGVQEARGEVLLFTDGDVMLEPATLRHAVAAMRRHGLDHLAVFPDAMAETLGESMMLTLFSIIYGVQTRFPLARYRWAGWAFAGVGAFNMVRRSAYAQIGGHEPLRLEVADDMMLGWLIKRADGVQDVRMGAGLVRVKWHAGVVGIIRGLEKNAFAGARYSLPVAIVGSVLLTLLTVGPLVLTFTGPARPVFAAVTLVYLVTAWRTASACHFPRAGALGFPLAAVLLSFAVLRSTWRTLRDGGVTWRDTFYSLGELRAGMVSWQRWPAARRGTDTARIARIAPP